MSTIKQEVSSQNTPAVLVFYASKDSADLANKIVNTLRDSKKYKSSASFASLGDIVSKEWIKKDKISVAASGDHEALANDIKNLIDKNVSPKNEVVPMWWWAFKASDVQIYIPY